MSTIERPTQFATDFNFRMAEDMKAELFRIAKARDRSPGAEARIAIRKHLEDVRREMDDEA